jgi:hypothetical protein
MDAVRGRDAEEAMVALQFLNKRASPVIRKLIESAVANAEEFGNREGVDIDTAELLREAFLKAGERLRGHLESATQAQVDAPFREFPDGSRTVGGGVHFLHFHESYHLGQIGLLRRVTGKPGIS